MREILFRGKRTYNGEWAFGCYSYDRFTGTTKICSFDSDRGYAYAVIPETVGQYTGLTDKNGIMIFEGDIVSTDLERPYNIVVFRDGCFMFNCNDGDRDYYDIMLPILRSEHTHYEYGEVIGNLYDNPELLIRSDTE